MNTRFIYPVSSLEVESAAVSIITAKRHNNEHDEPMLTEAGA